MPSDRNWAYTRDPQIKKLRAIAMVRDKVMGFNKQELAEKYRVSETTVERTLTYARRANIIVEEMDNILQDMVPLARGVLIDALKDGDRSVALEVFKGTGLLGNKGKPSGANADDDELLRSMHEIRQRAQLLAETTEGQLLDSQLPELPAASTGAAAVLSLRAAGESEEDFRLEADLEADSPADSAAFNSGPPPASPEALREADDAGGSAETEQSPIAGRPGEPGDVHAGE